MAINVSVQHNGGFLPDIMYMYGHKYSKSMDQPGVRLPVLHVVRLTGKMNISLSAFVYTVDPMLLPSGNPFKCHEEVLYLHLMIDPT